jgi:hypothetical protein
LRHEHPPIDVQANGLTHFNPRSRPVGAITIDHLAIASFDLRKRWQGGDQQYKNKDIFHIDTLS